MLIFGRIIRYLSNGELAIFLYFLAISLPQVFTQFQSFTVSPEKAVRRQSLPEYSIAEQIGPEYQELWARTATSSGSVCLSKLEFERITTDIRGFDRYFTGKREIKECS